MAKSILLVEDDFFIRDLYKIALTDSGYVVDEAADGEEAIAKAKVQVYHLILLDIMLPKITGIDVLKTIRTQDEFQSKSSPVIVTSNLGQESIVNSALKLGAAKYLLKAQTNVKDLINEVNSLFETSAARS
jgi:DNA-binding response OmpR family regulator